MHSGISVVVPVYNEEKCLHELNQKIHGIMSKFFKEYELIFVDDGSSDGSPNKLREISALNPSVFIITLRRNFGKAIALQCGFRKAKYDVIATMDADLQDDPSELPDMVAKLNQGYDLVSGWKRERQDPLEKRLPSKFFNKIVSLISGLKLHDFNCGLKVYKSWSLKDVHIQGNLYRFLPVFVFIAGGKVTEMPVSHKKRVFGTSKYGIGRYLHGFFDIITIFVIVKFSKSPLYFFGLLSMPLLLISMFFIVWLVGGHLLWTIGVFETSELVNRPLLILVLALFSIGLQILSIGVLAELFLYINSDRLQNDTPSYIKSVHSAE